VNNSGQIIGDRYLAGDTAYHAAVWHPLTPAQAITNLVTVVDGLNFPPGAALLRAALASLNSGHTGVACGQLSAFINQVSAASGQSLTVAQANQLIVSTTEIQAALACS
jgi:hypothetical protein